MIESQIVETAPQIYTVEEYLDLEEKSKVKHEFHNGQIIEKAGGTIPHNLIAARAIKVLGNHIDTAKDQFFILNSDQKIHIPLTNRFVYSDGLVVSGKPETVLGRNDLLANPLLIVEIMSESTQGYDEGDKFDNYCSIPSFREYLLLSQTEYWAKSFFLHDPETNLWKISRAKGADATIFLYSIGMELKLEDIYKDILVS